MRKRPAESHSDDDAAAFREAVRGAVPLRAPQRARAKRAEVPPVPVQSLLDVHEALAESGAGSIPWEQSMETGEELAYLRPGLAADVLKKLRRGHWVVEDGAIPGLDLAALMHAHGRAAAELHQT